MIFFSLSLFYKYLTPCLWYSINNIIIVVLLLSCNCVHVYVYIKLLSVMNDPRIKLLACCLIHMCAFQFKRKTITPVVFKTLPGPDNVSLFSSFYQLKPFISNLRGLWVIQAHLQLHVCWQWRNFTQLLWHNFIYPVSLNEGTANIRCKTVIHPVAV